MITIEKAKKTACKYYELDESQIKSVSESKRAFLVCFGDDDDDALVAVSKITGFIIHKRWYDIDDGNFRLVEGEEDE